MKCLKHVLILCLLLAIPYTSQATVYWASPTGSNVAACASIDSVNDDNGSDPGSYGTINRAAVCATSPGDKINIKPGTYTSANDRITTDGNCTGTCLASGTSESVRTVIQGVPGQANPVIKTPGGFIGFWRANPRNYITIQNITTDGASETDAGGSTLNVTGHHNIVQDIIQYDSYNMAIFTYDDPSVNHDLIFRRITSYGHGRDGNGYCIYISSATTIIERVECYGTRGGGIQVWHYNTYGANADRTVRYNYVHDILAATQTGFSGCFGIIVTGANSLVYNNVIEQDTRCSGDSPGIGTGYYSTDTSKFYNNLVYNFGSNGIDIGRFANVSNTEAKNNLVLGNSSNQILVRGTSSVTQATNKTTGSLTDCTVSTSDFTHKAASSCIDAGTAIVGYSYNGSAPDIGAFETLVFSTCVVENGDASNMRVTFSNNLFPPLLPSSNADTGGFTTRKAGAANAVTATTRVGDNRVDLTLTNAIVNGNAIDVSYTPGGQGDLTDSALIGNSLKQPYITTLTQQSCTNNVGAAASHLFIQAKFEFHDLRGTEAAPVVKPYSGAPEDTNTPIVPGGKVRLRIALTCTTADCPPTGFYPFYACAACTTAGTYTLIPDSFATDEDVALCGTTSDPDIPNSGTSTTDQLSTAGTFVAGALVRTSNAIPTIDLAQNNKTELEYCIAFDTDAVADRVYTFRVYKQDSTAIDTYTVTPQITVRSMSAGMGF